MSATYRLDHVCDISMGQAPAGEAYNDVGDGWPLIAGAGDFGDVYPSPKKYTREASRVSRRGDIVVGIRASIGEKVLADGEYCLGRGVAGIRAGKDLDSRFLWHWLTHATPTLMSKARGATFLQVNKGDIGELEIVLPPLEEQRRIAAILDQAETLRTQRRQALAHLDSLTQSLFLDMFGDPQANSKGWRTQALTGFFQFRTGKLDSNAATADGEYPFFTCSREDFRIDTYAFDCEALLLAGNNANADYSIKHYRGKFNAYQRTYVLTVADAANSYVYARVVLEMKLQELKRESKGSSTKYLTLGLMDRLKLPVPDPALQQTFATRIQAIEVLKATHRTALAQLDALFASLQQRAFAGEL